MFIQVLVQPKKMKLCPRVLKLSIIYKKLLIYRLFTLTEAEKSNVFTLKVSEVGDMEGTIQATEFDDLSVGNVKHFSADETNLTEDETESKGFFL